MSRVIRKACERCGAPNEFDLDDLVGMPLRNAEGEIVGRPPVELDKPIHVQCDACGGPFIVTEDDLP